MMDKNRFIKGAIILVIGAFITKVLGMVIKIIITRYIGLEGISIYMLIIPTFTLFINIATFGFPVAISKMVAEDKKSNKHIIFSILPVSIILNIFLLVIVYLISPIISNLLHDSRTYYPLIAIGLVLPFISISGIIRSYFFGKEKMIPHTVSNIFEQIVRLILIIILIPILMTKYSLEIAVTSIVLVNIISELTSIIILIFFLPKKTIIKKSDIFPDKKIIKDAFNIGIPTTSSRVIGSIGYFFEPIILTAVLTSVGYSSTYIINEYGIINGYVLPLLMIPSFFAQTISSALIPAISKEYVKNNIKYVKNKLKQGLIMSISIGIITTIAFLIKPLFFLKLIYNTTNGVEYLTMMAPFFLIYYIQVPLTSTLIAVGKAKEAMMSTVTGMIVRIALLYLTSLLRIGLYSLLIASIVNIFIVTIYNYKKIKKVIK